MLHYYEKILIAIIIFLGVTIGTAGIIGNYVKVVRDSKPNPNAVVLENINI